MALHRSYIYAPRRLFRLSSSCKPLVLYFHHHRARKEKRIEHCLSVDMIWNCLLVLSVLGSLPFSSAVPADLVPRQTTDTSVQPTRSHPTSQAHTPFTGTPTTTGVLTASSSGSGISGEGPAPGATNYPSDGNLHSAQPAGYVPAGGVGTNGSEPVYNAKSDFDYESLVCNEKDRNKDQKTKPTSRRSDFIRSGSSSICSKTGSTVSPIQTFQLQVSPLTTGT
jgi:hypothetical protein